MINSSVMSVRFKSSVSSLCMCSSKQLFNLFAVMVDLKYICRCLRAENVLSAVADVIGMVKISSESFHEL